MKLGLRGFDFRSWQKQSDGSHHFQNKGQHITKAPLTAEQSGRLMCKLETE